MHLHGSLLVNPFSALMTRRQKGSEDNLVCPLCRFVVLPFDCCTQGPKHHEQKEAERERSRARRTAKNRGQCKIKWALTRTIDGGCAILRSSPLAQKETSYRASCLPTAQFKGQKTLLLEFLMRSVHTQRKCMHFFLSAPCELVNQK